MKEEKDTTFYLRERMESRFERTFMLPTEADLKHVRTSFRAGGFEVHVPKLEQAKPRQIDIKA